MGAMAPSPATVSTSHEAQQFLSLLSPAQRATAIDAASAYDWHYVPKDRKGIAWASLDTRQREAAHRLLRSALSRLGYKKAEEIRALEPILRAQEGGNPGRDPERYHFLFFAEPTDEGAWGWRYEGHHLSLTFVYRKGALVSSTPQFLGSNPAKTPDGRRVLAKEQDLAFDLMDSLSTEQRTRAVIATEAPGDIITGANRKAAIEGHRGLSYKDLDSTQQKKLLTLLRAHAEVQSDQEQNRRLHAIEHEELNSLVFAWMGPSERGGRHYYRIQGQNLLIEYDNTQNDGNHIHTVWRNLKEDFGGDALEEHYQHGHHHDHR